MAGKTTQAGAKEGGEKESEREEGECPCSAVSELLGKIAVLKRPFLSMSPQPPLCIRPLSFSPRAYLSVRIHPPVILLLCLSVTGGCETPMKMTARAQRVCMTLHISALRMHF